MADLATLVVRLIGDATKYQETLEKAEKDSTSFASRVTSGLASVGGTIVTGAAWAAGAAFTGLGFLVKGAFSEAANAEEVLASLNSTLANTGPITGVTADMVTKLADQFAGLTRFEDDMVTSGGEVIARFSQIGKDIFPDVLRGSLDLATKWKTDVPTAATIYAKALAAPGEGLMKLKSAGIVFTDEQEKMIQKMTEAGDVAGAQAIIMDVVNKTVGGAAEAAGKTAGGTWERLKNIWGNVLETLGGGLIPAITNLGQTATTWLSRPEVQAGVEKLAIGIGNFATTVITNLPTVVQWFQNAFGWLQENQGVIVGALAAIGVAVGAWVYTVVIPAAIAAVTAMAPIILVMAIVAGLAYLIYTAWTQNWGGIQEKTAEVWQWIQDAIAAAMLFIQQVIEVAMTIIGPLVKAFSAAMSGDWYAFGENLRQAWDAAWALITQVVSTAWNSIQTIVGDLINNVINFFTTTNWGEVGSNIVQGIANGLRNSISWIIDAAKAAAQAALDAAKGFLGIHSPSQVFQTQVGWQMGAGQASGYTDALDKLLKPAFAFQIPAVGNMNVNSAPAGMMAGGASRTIVVPVTINDQSFINVNSEYEAKRKLRDIVNEINRENENK